ncbi:CHAT domain-containing protein [Fischerella sp. PCC 9605]|uniref:CHAT domain-containing protein n=1 Tax=Fischerella sp. PCC 9605 TaxID=1173024 RepID=UPI00047BA81B|nr:CHAT domain-containing protein [Fischerella sp. PCC 9605]
MRGISSSIPIQNEFFPLDILITETSYRISINDFSRSATDSVLLNFTKNVLQCFQEIEKTINKKKELQLTIEERNYYLKSLAKWGRRAYQEFFNEDAQKATFQYSQLMKFAPIFVSKLLPFPWEVLYEGEYQQADPEKFWGFCHPIARNITPGKTAPLEQILPLNMLFCLHHKLLHAHHQERPEIEKLVRTLGKFYLLQLSKELKKLADGESLVTHLYQTQHNILHFACHCRPCRQYEDEIDALVISFIEDESNAQEIELETYNFSDVSGSFQCQPLIFLNACQSAGGVDELRKTFNLPEKFIQHGAAAVIATACPVPDLFAAAFASVFYNFFIGEKMMIGKALCETRRYFLEKYNNPLGLAYGLYSSPYYRIAQVPAVLGVN